MGFHLKLAGVTFGNRQANISKLQVGEKLKLVREPDNEYDRFAVLVTTEAGIELGYIPSANNGRIAYNLDQGKKYEVTVSQVTGGGIGVNYGLNIYLEEK